ncbi:MAG: AAA family ATPase [Candidatus Vecturithrix sp.]|jgi:adenylate kinase family enzyme|nr:AAA family ATPase [Candidatus Vecturithrix sp.]
MRLCFCGPSGSGKSTCAKNIAKQGRWNIYTGKDYLRLAKNEAEAWSKFMAQLKENDAHGMNSIIVITEIELLKKVKEIEQVCIIRFTANEDVLLKRFIARINNHSNPTFAKMIKNQKMKWDQSGIDYVIDTTENNEERTMKKILEQNT